MIEAVESYPGELAELRRKAAKHDRLLAGLRYAKRESAHDIYMYRHPGHLYIRAADVDALISEPAAAPAPAEQ